MDSFQPTGEGFVGAASNADQVLDDVLTVCSLAASTLAQQDNGLILTSGQEVPISRLGHVVNVRGSVLPFAALKHLHHLAKKRKGRSRKRTKSKRGSYTYETISLYANFVVIVFL